MHDRDYFARREAEESSAAERATGKARDAHLHMARLYRERLEKLRDGNGAAAPAAAAHA
jgi:hypothetical protein